MPGLYHLEDRGVTCVSTKAQGHSQSPYSSDQPYSPLPGVSCCVSPLQSVLTVLSCMSGLIHVKSTRFLQTQMTLRPTQTTLLRWDEGNDLVYNPLLVGDKAHLCPGHSQNKTTHFADSLGREGQKRSEE